MRGTFTRLIAATPYAERVTGTTLIEGYDAEAGRRAERALEDSLAAQVAAVAISAAVAAARSRVPSARASRFSAGRRSPRHAPRPKGGLRPRVPGPVDPEYPGDHLYDLVRAGPNANGPKGAQHVLRKGDKVITMRRRAGA